jgi:hypothetical protein
MPAADSALNCSRIRRRRSTGRESDVDDHVGGARELMAERSV